MLEICALLLAMPVATTLRFTVTSGEAYFSAPLWLAALIYAVVMHACTMAMGIYAAGFRDGLGAMAVRSLVAYCLLGCGLLTILYYLVPELYMGRGVLALAIIFTFVALTLIRIVFFKMVDRETLRPRLLILGTGNRAANIARELVASHRGVAAVVGFIQAQKEDAMEVEGAVIQRNQTLLDIALEHEANEIVVALEDRRATSGGAMPLNELFECKMNGIRISEPMALYERELGLIELNEIGPGWLVFSAGFSSSALWDQLKRITDILVSILLLLIVWPLMLFAVVLILLETGRPVIYRQTRTGLANEPFQIQKFRSMTINAERDGQAVWASENDSRVTRVGAFLRNTRIDELPQLFNVLRGEMSFVGPRPERPEFVEKFVGSSMPYYNERHRVKPGLMGWAQLNYPYGASVDDAEKKLRYDLYYVKNRSLTLDIIIMVQTVQIILLGSGVR
jgi:sugar transferase (PEP-CTERM system associated)